MILYWIIGIMSLPIGLLALGYGIHKAMPWVRETFGIMSDEEAAQNSLVVK